MKESVCNNDGYIEIIWGVMIGGQTSVGSENVFACARCQLTHDWLPFPVSSNICTIIMPMRANKLETAGP